MSCLLLETPLTLAATTQNPRKLLLTLVSGGAHLDFRAKDGTTALHRAAQHGNYDAIKVFSIIILLNNLS